MAETAIIEPIEDAYDPRDVELIRKVYQLSLFGEATDEDFRKTIYLLRSYRSINEIVENYEFVINEALEDGLNEYDLSGVEGRVKRLSPTDLISDVTSNTIIAKEERHINYLMCKKIRNRILFAARNISDVHECQLIELLFTGKRKYKYKDAQIYMASSRKKEISSIQATTFADKRRKVIASLTKSLLLNGTLDFVAIRYGPGMDVNGQLGLSHVQQINLM